MHHGDTNRTETVGDSVRKTFEGADARGRHATELSALRSLAGEIPVPEVREAGARWITTGLVSGRRAHDLLAEIAARGEQDSSEDGADLVGEVLASCGRLLRRLHGLDPALLDPLHRVGGAEPGQVIVHGDFGPQSLLLDETGRQVVGVLDWEFCHVGDPVRDLAWCEWNVRMHLPAAAPALPAFYEAYGHRPSWETRRSAMLRRCLELEIFALRSEETGRAAAQWRARHDLTRTWSDPD